MTEYTPFGLAVKTKLLEPPVRTQEWLIKKINAQTGLKVDSSFMSKLLTGSRRSLRAETCICEILDISQNLF